LQKFPLLLKGKSAPYFFKFYSTRWHPVPQAQKETPAVANFPRVALLGVGGKSNVGEAHMLNFKYEDDI
jgi:hypothetical protein